MCERRGIPTPVVLVCQDDVSEYMSQHAAELLSHKAVQATKFWLWQQGSPVRSADQAITFDSASSLDLSALVGRSTEQCICG